MGLRETIKKVLKEETPKDFAKSIKKLVKLSFDKEYEDVICNIKVTNPKDRKVLKYQQEPHKHYRVDIIFKDNTIDYYEITNEVENIIKGFLGIDVAIFYKIQDGC